MNFAEKIERVLLELRLARANLKDDDLEAHKRDIDRIVRDLDQAIKDYWEAENG